MSTQTPTGADATAGASPDRLVLRSGAGRTDGWDLEITPESAGWAHSGLRVVSLTAGRSRTVQTGDDEVVVLSLGGSARVKVDDTTFELAGRPHVFAGPSDVVYAPIRAELRITSEAGGRFALCAARAGRRLARLTCPPTPSR